MWEVSSSHLMQSGLHWCYEFAVVQPSPSSVLRWWHRGTCRFGPRGGTTSACHGMPCTKFQPRNCSQATRGKCNFNLWWAHFDPFCTQRTSKNIEFSWKPVEHLRVSESINLNCSKLLIRQSKQFENFPFRNCWTLHCWKNELCPKLRPFHFSAAWSSAQ